MTRNDEVQEALFNTNKWWRSTGIV